MNLRELLDSHAPDVEVQGLAEHSEEVEPGMAFVCVASDPATAQAHARRAIERGAVAVLAEQNLDSLGVPVCAVADLSARRGPLAARFHGDPSRLLACIGVTGTNGKTSIAWHVADLSSRLGVPAGYAGTLGWGVLPALAEAGMTTANAVALQRQLAAMLGDGARRAALEVSSHALHQHRADAVAFEYAVFSNLTRDHLDYHGTLDAYRAAKTRLFTDWPLRAAVLNADDPVGVALAAETRAEQVVTYGHAGEWRWQTRPHAAGLDVTWATPLGAVSAALPVLADYAVANVTAALAVLAALGHGAGELESALAGLAPVPGRMEVVNAGGGRPTVVVDYAHTPDALEKALTALRAHCRGRLICVVGCGGDRDAGKRPMMGEVGARLADLVWLTSDNPRSEDPAQIIADMRAGVGQGVAWECADRREAICRALHDAADSDVVLIAGKGHEGYQDIGGRRLPFDDRVVARSVLAEMGET